MPDYELYYLLGRIKESTLQESKGIITPEKALENIKKDIEEYEKRRVK